MLKPYLLAGTILSCLTPALALAPNPVRAFGEPRVIPDYDFYFNNRQLTLYPEATVTKVLSGNRLLVQLAGERDLRTIELAGIDSVGGLDATLEAEAIALLEEALLHQNIRLEGDDFLRDPEGEGEIQAYIWLNGEQLNDTLVRAGLAVVRNTNYNFRHRSQLRQSQSDAIDRELGVWGTDAIDRETEVQILFFE